MGSLNGSIDLILLIVGFIGAVVAEELINGTRRWRRPGTRLDDAERELFLRTYKYKDDR